MDEVYRAVNEYIDYTTTDRLLKYSKVYSKPGPAKAYATRMRHAGYNKGTRLKEFGNPNGTKFEYISTWVERATKWERI